MPRNIVLLGCCSFVGLRFMALPKVWIKEVVVAVCLLGRAPVRGVILGASNE